MDSITVSDKLCKLLAEITARSIDASTDADLPLRDLGLSSLRMIQLIGDLESAFQIRVGDEDVDEDNFGTLSGLRAFVEGRTQE